MPFLPDNGFLLRLFVGQKGNLGIIVKSFDPKNIECGSVEQSYTRGDSCDHLLQAIPTDKAPAKWGPPRQAGVEWGLPYAWELNRAWATPQVIGLADACSAFNCRLMVWGQDSDMNVRDEMTFFELCESGECHGVSCLITYLMGAQKSQKSCGADPDWC